jgi:L-lactate dehydrogenase complex protein LldG
MAAATEQQGGQIMSQSSQQSRHQILGRIRKGLGRDALCADKQQALIAAMAQPKRNLVPQRAQAQGQAAIDMFIAMATEAAAEITHLESLEQLPEQLKNLIPENDPRPLVIASETQLTGLDWPSAGVTTVQRVAQKGDLISLTSCIAGVAETGTLVLKSGPSSPTTLNLLPDIHCVLLRREDVIGGYEDAWDLVRQAKLPRTVNFITGPSRSADIEQKLQMGAHGPKRLIIYMI